MLRRGFAMKLSRGKLISPRVLLAVDKAVTVEPVHADAPPLPNDAIVRVALSRS
jgi:hypothetical protein